MLSSPPGFNDRFGKIKTVFQIFSFFALAEFSFQNSYRHLFYPPPFFDRLNDQLTGVVLVLAQIDIFYQLHFKGPEAAGRIKDIDLREDQYHTSELIIEAIKKGRRVKEVPITILKRKFGKSKKGKNLKYGFYFAKTIIKAWWRR